MNKYIKQLVKEQFNISDIDFSSDENEYGANIFSKYVIDPNDIFTKMINRRAVSANDIKELNNLVSAVKPKNKNELKRVVHYYSKYCPQDSLNWIDVSGITNMCKLFNSNDRYTNNCECDISQWDVSNVTDMSYMFEYSKFKNDISKWNVSKVRHFESIFYECNIIKKYKPRKFR